MKVTVKAVVVGGLGRSSKSWKKEGKDETSEEELRQF